MSGIPYDPQAKLQVRLAAHSPHTFAYKLWKAKSGDTRWTEVVSGDDGSDDVEVALGDADHFAYTLLVGGNPDTDWEVQVTLEQGDKALACSPRAETGLTDQSGVARRDTAIRLV